MRRIRFFWIILFFGMLIPAISHAQNAISGDIPFEKALLHVGNQSEEVAKDIFSAWIKVEPFLYRDPGVKAEIENINFCPNGKILCDLLISQRELLDVRKKSNLSIEKDKIRVFLEDLTPRVDKDPVDAKFQVEDGKVSVFTLAENGIKLNVAKSGEIIAENLTRINSSFQEVREINLDYEKVEPEIKSESIETMGITSLIGEGKSDFRGSPKNRVYNIGVAIERFNGTLIRSGEEFSFVKTLGPVDAEHGYAPELVIKRDKTEPEFGGGICQVSTTAFRAAIYSGLEITARRNHAYPVRYYNPQGLDATVYIPRPDLRFINNTPSYILIQAKIEGTQLIFDFYGTSDGRTVEIEGPKVLESNPDGSMKTTFTQIVKDKDGNEIIRDAFKSNYDSPSKYPHPGEEVFTKKPKDWKQSEWEAYKKAHGM